MTPETFAAHHHLPAGHHARHLALFADDDLGRLHVALDLAVDLQHAAADDLQPLADDLEIVADHRLLGAFRSGWGGLLDRAIVGHW